MIISVKREALERLFSFLTSLNLELVIASMAVTLSLSMITIFFVSDKIIAYGDAESHLNIAKRVISGLTPGMAQLGGIWLPLPHILMMPLLYFDFFWRTGLGGSVISGLSFIIASLYLYKLTLFITSNKFAGFIACLVFVNNPNILYLQSVPMTEMPLTMFFLLSSYYFIKFLHEDRKILLLVFSALFGFCASLTRYDGWFLVFFEAVVLVIYELRKGRTWAKIEGKLILFSTLAFLGIALWFFWDFLILGDPLYFSNSQFTAHAQQQVWLGKGMLPGYHNPIMSFMYYLVTSMSNIGLIVFSMAILGLFLFLKDKSIKLRFLVVLIMIVPFIFYVTTLSSGQSVIFIPHLSPSTFEWTLFNARYGLMMIPLAAFCLGYLFYRVKIGMKLLILLLCMFQFILYFIGYSRIITLTDGTEGLSQSKRPDAEFWLAKNYDHGLVLLDDYSRLISIIRSGIPMQSTIYIGNKPYWEESLKEPEKYARWIIVQKGDDVWKNLYEPIEMQGRLYKYFEKVYTSPEIIIFRKK